MRYKYLGRTSEKLPVLGQGTRGILTSTSKKFFNKYLGSLNKGIELGMSHIDIHENHYMQGTYNVLKEIFSKYPREDLFITKTIEINSSDAWNIKAILQLSLNKLKLKEYDLILLNRSYTRSSLKVQMKIMDQLVEEGYTRYIGVSHFSLEKFIEAQKLLKRNELVANQLKLNIPNHVHLQEFLPYYQRENITVIACSPFDSDGLQNIEKFTKQELEHVAEEYDAKIYQIALAWLINHDNIISIPRSFNIKHVEENAKAVDIELPEEELKHFYYQMVNGF